MDKNSDGSGTRSGFSGICDTRARPKPDPLPDVSRRVPYLPNLATFSPFLATFPPKKNFLLKYVNLGTLNFRLLSRVVSSVANGHARCPLLPARLQKIQCPLCPLPDFFQTGKCPFAHCPKVRNGHARGQKRALNPPEIVTNSPQNH